MRERAKEAIINAVGLSFFPPLPDQGASGNVHPIPDVHLGHGEAGGHHYHAGLRGTGGPRCSARHLVNIMVAIPWKVFLPSGKHLRDAG